VVDGVGGKATVNRLQEFLGVRKTDGITIKKELKKYVPSLTAYGYGTSGSGTVKYLQKWLGISQDGHWGAGTSKALQKKLGVAQDGIFGKASMQALQKYLNTNTKAVYPVAPAKTIVDKELDACKVQADWMKNYTYKWVQNPTINSSKKYGTCVTYVACVLQRIGILKSGQFIWHNGKGKVDGANNKMSVSYPSGTLKSLKSKLKAGDIVMVGDKSSTGAGGNSHICILSGKWDASGNPYVWDNQSASRVKKGNNGLHTYGGGHKIIALIRLK
jgi:hypothetical protein